MARLVYLCTFIKDGTGELVMRNIKSGKERAMRRTDLQKVLGISKTATFKFYHAVIGTYVIEHEDGKLAAKSEFALRGKMRGGASYAKVFRSNVRKLYEGTATTKHRYLGYVFRLLPYLNIEWNILCWNPMCGDLHEVDPMTMPQFCDEIGYDSQKAAVL